MNKILLSKIKDKEIQQYKSMIHFNRMLLKT